MRRKHLNFYDKQKILFSYARARFAAVLQLNDEPDEGVREVSDASLSARRRPDYRPA
jgi:hypothetical protein